MIDIIVKFKNINQIRKAFVNGYHYIIAETNIIKEIFENSY